MTKPKTVFDKPTKWNPMGSMLLLVPTIEPERTDGGIVLPDIVRRKATSGFIAKRGPHADPAFAIGDEVFFEQHSEYRIKLDDTDEEAVLVDSFKVLLHMPAVSETSHGGGTIGGTGQSLDIPPGAFIGGHSRGPVQPTPSHDANGVRVQ